MTGFSMPSFRRWFIATFITWSLFLVCNAILNYSVLRPLFHFRTGCASIPLTGQEVTEVLIRAGGIEVSAEKKKASATDSNSGLNIDDPFGVLLRKVGLTVGFSSSQSPDRCVIKWFPEIRRPRDVASDSAGGSRSDQNRDSAFKLYWAGSVDPTAFNLVLESKDDTVSYYFHYGTVQTERRILLKRMNSQFLPIQPVSVSTNLNELVSEFIRQIPQLLNSEEWRADVFGGGQSYSENINPPLDAEKEQIARAVEGVLIQVLSHGGTSSPEPNAARQVPNIQDQTLLSCIVNGSNQLGWIQFVIGVIFVRGLIAVLASKSEKDSEAALKKNAIETLPALGFLGTLLGMSTAFANGLDDRNNLTQSLMLAIATSALALVGALIILWMDRQELNP